MTTGFTNYFTNQILNLFLNGTAYSWPATIYVGLFTTNPTTDVAGSGTEASGSSYARVAVTVGAGTFGAASLGSSTNSVAAVTFPASTTPGFTATGAGIWDASTSGHLLCWGALTSNLVIGFPATYSFGTSQLTVSVV